MAATGTGVCAADAALATLAAAATLAAVARVSGQG